MFTTAAPAPIEMQFEKYVHLRWSDVQRLVLLWTNSCSVYLPIDLIKIVGSQLGGDNLVVLFHKEKILLLNIDAKEMQLLTKTPRGLETLPYSSAVWFEHFLICNRITFVSDDVCFSSNLTVSVS